MNSKYTILKNEPMSKHTSFRVGGLARQYFKPKSLENLVDFIKDNPGENMFWLGLGSNLLVRDGGINGTVIAQGSGMDLLSHQKNIVNSEVGVSCAKLARYCAKQGLYGLDFLAGIPGLLGGALAMNAGAFGGEIWPWVKSVVTINSSGELNNRTPDDYIISYRSVVSKHDFKEWFVSAEFALENKSNKQNIKSLLAKRNDSQPIGLPSCGSVFKNPPNNHAAKLIDLSGLKGFCLGKACVSEKHANFIINTGGATAIDIENLIIHIQEVVLKNHAVNLETEVKIVGDLL